jgi:hypothetical protein
VDETSIGHRKMYIITSNYAHVKYGLCVSSNLGCQRERVWNPSLELIRRKKIETPTSHIEQEDMQEYCEKTVIGMAYECQTKSSS